MTVIFSYRKGADENSGENILEHSQLEVRTNSNDIFILGNIQLVKFISGMEWEPFLEQK